jgi:pre-60S factor REI1
MAANGLLTCMTCSVAFKEADGQRDHYKTDWHRYNLKRKVAELPPVSESDFKSRMDKHEEQRKLVAGETKRPSGYCVACSKSFATDKAYENHLNSKKHLEAAKVSNLDSRN